MDNSLASAISSADLKAKYDENTKKILSEKEVLAWILKSTTSEFAQISIGKIIKCIEGEPEVSKIKVNPGETNGSENLQRKITGAKNEDKVPNEGTITYDIRFYAIVLGAGKVKLLLNVEAQKSYYPGYDIVTRGIFYCARMLSAQLDTEFSSSDYDNIKKVYSIWICMNVPNYIADTITKYSICPEDITGEFSASARYDLLSVLMIRIGKKEKEKEHPLIGMLSVLLSRKIKPTEKEEILNRQFGIKTTIELKERFHTMCNLSDLVEEEAWERGLKSGMREGMREGVRKGIRESIFLLLEDFGEVSEEIREKIMAEDDIDILKKWNKMAARVESIESFQEKI